MIHAYTIEIIQLLILLASMVNIYHVFGPLNHGNVSSTNNDPPPRVLSTLVFGSICLFAVDGFDNLIQLRSLTHPIQSQTLLLTRRWLFPGTLLVLKKKKKEVKFVKTTKPTALLLSMDEVKRRSRLRRMTEELQTEFNAIRAGMEFNLSRQYDSDSSDGSFGGYIREVSRLSQERDKILLPQLDEMQERFDGESCRKEEEVRSMFVAQLQELKDTFGGPVR
ncbi:uncharacterized protein MYCGRDRAFT_88971 [Zymoseptoria tritici IPO323]|uniref:Uncharacterized protein n=1 Tax=Zymoseptoria tritici (strain CBS 115943 / IPO323) TaxID=336722 RepID=F9WYY5_ZYMTI|nr:uncharacterized protein MYCGRDRAFT_88971 [Zymoseptoria tritici IPO323]EGP92589.1 hypothetical protein MYCGRDRAFT_88971 [Zymoseptoria tritici IPO323]